MARDLYCHACNATTPSFDHSGSEQPLCPACSSDFVEFRDHVELRSSQETAMSGAEDLQFPANPMEIMSRIMTALTQDGAQVMWQGPGGVGGPLNLGDFGTGTMEEIMTQIMEQHQPQNHPTSEALRNNLPKRKVPASSHHKGNEEYAVGENCKAGDPCSICHTEFAAEEEVSQLPCEHCFHDACIKPWLEVQNTCPICRAVMPGSEEPSRPADSGLQQPGGQQPGQNGNAPNFHAQGNIQHNFGNLLSGMNLFGLGGMGFGGGGVENLVAGTGRGAQEPGVPAWLNMHGFENQNPQPSQNPPPPSQNPPPAQSPEPSQNPPARQTPPNNDNPVPSAEPIPRTINWLTGEGTPGNRRVDMNEMRQLMQDPALLNFLGIPAENQHTVHNEEASDVSSGSSGDHSEENSEESESDDADNEMDSESNSMLVYPGSESTGTDGLIEVGREADTRPSIDEVIPSVHDLSPSPGNPMSFQSAYTTGNPIFPHNGIRSTANPLSSSTDQQGSEQRSRPSNRDPYQIGFAGPPRVEGSSMVRSNSSDVEGNSQQEDGRGGAGIFTPLGWLARGAMHFGRNVFGRRNQ